MNKLREILKPYILDPSRAEAAIKSYINEEIIGEDEEESIYHPDAGDLLSQRVIDRNELRAEQRAKLDPVIHDIPAYMRNKVKEQNE